MQVSVGDTKDYKERLLASGTAQSREEAKTQPPRGQTKSTQLQSGGSKQERIAGRTGSSSWGCQEELMGLSRAGRMGQLRRRAKGSPGKKNCINQEVEAKLCKKR